MAFSRETCRAHAGTYLAPGAGHVEEKRMGVFWRDRLPWLNGTCSSSSKMPPLASSGLVAPRGVATG